MSREREQHKRAKRANVRRDAIGHILWWFDGEDLLALNKGNGSEYRLVSVLIFLYGLRFDPWRSRDSTRSAGVLGASTECQIEGISFDRPVMKFFSLCTHMRI